MEIQTDIHSQLMTIVPTQCELPIDHLPCVSCLLTSREARRPLDPRAVSHPCPRPTLHCPSSRLSPTHVGGPAILASWRWSLPRHRLGMTSDTWRPLGCSWWCWHSGSPPCHWGCSQSQPATSQTQCWGSVPPPAVSPRPGDENMCHHLKLCLHLV